MNTPGRGGLRWNDAPSPILTPVIPEPPTDYGDLMAAVLRNVPDGSVTVSLDEIQRTHGEEVVVVRDDAKRTVTVKLMSRCVGCGELEDENHPMGGACVLGGMY